MLVETIQKNEEKKMKLLHLCKIYLGSDWSWSLLVSWTQ